MSGPAPERMTADAAWSLYHDGSEAYDDGVPFDEWLENMGIVLID